MHLHERANIGPWGLDLTVSQTGKSGFNQM